MNGKLTALQRQYLSRLGKAEVEQPTLTGDLLSDLVDGWAKYTTTRLKDSLANSKLPGNPTSGRASYSLYQSLDAAKTRRRGNDVIGAINANDYYSAVDQGQKPGQPVGPLFRALGGDMGWVRQKGIILGNQWGKTDAQQRNNFAYAVARKINKKGTVGNKFFSKIINDATFDEFAEYLGRAMGQKIALSISVMAKQDK
jgi:hypothetical protein